MPLEFEFKEAADATTVVFRGQIDAAVGDVLAKLALTLKTTRLHFDCGGITRINSIGITMWLKALDTFSDRTYSFFNCTEQFVDAAVMIPHFPGKGWIESLFVQFVCENCQHEVSRLLSAKDGQAPNCAAPGPCPKCSAPLEPEAGLEGNLESLNERGSFGPRA